MWSRWFTKTDCGILVLNLYGRKFTLSFKQLISDFNSVKSYDLHSVQFQCSSIVLLHTTTSIVVKLTLALEQMNFAKIKSKYNIFSRPYFGKTVRFRCFTNIDCVNLLPYARGCKIHPLLRVSESCRDKVWIKKFSLAYALKNRKILVLHDYILRDFNVPPLWPKKSASR